MNTTWSKAHRIFVIVLLITILHFILTSVIGHYIANQIGTQMGQIVAGGLIEANESPQTSEEEVKRIYQNMKNKGNDIIESWKIPLILVSLPTKPIIYTLLKKFRRTWIYDPAISGDISREQFKRRVIIIDNIVNFINSLSLGLVVYLILRLYNHYKLKHNNKLQRMADSHR